MEFCYATTFKKQYRRLPKALQTQCDERILLFANDSRHPRLHNHPLQGKYIGYWSINVSGDVRALYKVVDDEVILFALIGTHSELY